MPAYYFQKKMLEPDYVAIVSRLSDSPALVVSGTQPEWKRFALVEKRTAARKAKIPATMA